METLHARVRLQWSLRALIFAAVLAGIAYGATLLLDLSDVVPLVVGAFTLLGLLGVAYAFALYRRWRFDLEADALYLVRGVVTHVETAVPYVRVQHVDTQRGPIDRLLGLASVVVYTAGSRGADVTVPGLTPDRADELRNRLRELAIETEPDDGV